MPPPFPKGGQGGFSVAELMVVMGIIALALGIGTFMSLTWSNQAKFSSLVRAFPHAVDLARSQAIARREDPTTGLKRTYLQITPKTDWSFKEDYRIEKVTAGNEYVIQFQFVDKKLSDGATRYYEVVMNGVTIPPAPSQISQSRIRFDPRGFALKETTPGNNDWKPSPYTFEFKCNRLSRTIPMAINPFGRIQ